MFEEILRYESRRNCAKYRMLLKELETKDESELYNGISKLAVELSLAEDNQLEGFPLEECM